MLNYVKKFKSNQIATIDKNKNPNRPIKGTAYLEIANDEDFKDMVYEARSENILTKEAIEDLFYYAMLNQKGASADTYPYNPFGRIVLTSHNGTEDATNKEILGDIIGFANAQIQYASTNPKQGNLDSIDSYTDYENRKIQFTFNFPSGKAVGTFQTVFWTNGREVEDDVLNSTDGHAYTPIPVETWDKTGIPSGTMVANSQGEIFILTKDFFYKYKLLQTGINKQLSLIETKPNPYAKQPYCGTFNPVTQEIWCYFYIGTSRTFHVFDSQMNFIRSMAQGNRPLWSDSYGFLNFMSFHGMWLYTVEYQTNKIYIHDYTGVYKTQTTAFLTGLKNVKGVYSDQKYLYIFYTDTSNRYVCETFKSDDTTGDLTSVSKTITNQTTFRSSSNSGAYLWDNMRNGYIIHSMGVFIKSFNYVTAQTLLVDPIIKDDVQYMRLRYHFQLPQ